MNAGRSSRVFQRVIIHDFAGHPFPFTLSRALARRGVQVTHLYFAEDPGPKGAARPRPDDPDGLVIMPVSLGRPYPKGQFWKRRLLDEAYGRAVGRKIATLRPDVVISGNAPPDAQKHILRACRRTGAGFVFWLQDSFARGVRAVVGGRFGGLGSLIAAHYERLEYGMLRTSDAVIVISDGFGDLLESAGVPPPRRYEIPNWAAIEDIPVLEKDNPCAREKGWAERFVFLYSGTLGLKHDPALLRRLAVAFGEDPDVLVAVASAGLGTDRLKEWQDQEPLANLSLLPLQPMARFPEMLAAADVLVALIEPEAAGYSVPSKVLSYLCAGRPLLLSIPADNLAARIVREAEAGIIVEPGDHAGFLEAARRLRSDADLRARLGANARRYAERAFDIDRITDRFEEVFTVALGQRGAA
ncbi:MAG: glycosyltransferase WbuB [Alphaproteobacteria bacterium]|nr:MAG: glycosyltransferase WbuB [Alphaproteobacteria bacterium]